MKVSHSQAYDKLKAVVKMLGLKGELLTTQSR
jgi:hypothetical protein